jgi:hypothetical protein
MKPSFAIGTFYARALNQSANLLMKSSKSSINAHLKSKSSSSGTAQFEARWKHQNVSSHFSGNFSRSSDLSGTLSKKHATGYKGWLECCFDLDRDPGVDPDDVMDEDDENATLEHDSVDNVAADDTEEDEGKDSEGHDGHSGAEATSL